MTRKLKKTETVEFRLPYETKQALSQHCKDQGVSVSEAIRYLIERDILNPVSARKPLLTHGRRLLAAIVAGLALGAVAAPSLAQQRAGTTAQFERLDHNADGVLSLSEFSAR